MKTTTISATHITTTTPNTKPNSTPTKSIRKICLEGILAGKSTDELKAEIIALHPNSAAAAKSGKHISWYRSWMKKEGMLPLDGE